MKTTFRMHSQWLPASMLSLLLVLFAFAFTPQVALAAELPPDAGADAAALVEEFPSIDNDLAAVVSDTGDDPLPSAEDHSDATEPVAQPADDSDTAEESADEPLDPASGGDTAEATNSAEDDTTDADANAPADDNQASEGLPEEASTDEAASVQAVADPVSADAGDGGDENGSDTSGNEDPAATAGEEQDSDSDADADDEAPAIVLELTEEQYQEFYEVIVSGLTDLQGQAETGISYTVSFDFPGMTYSASKTAIGEACNVLIHTVAHYYLNTLYWQNPDIFYVDNTVFWAGGSWRPIGYENDFSIALTLVYYPAYLYSDSEIGLMQTEYEAAVQEVLGWTAEADTEEGKVKAAHDWLVRNCAYNQDAASSSLSYGSLNPWNAYGALVEKSPVCQGYSLALKAILDRLNILCTYVTQEGQEEGEAGHAWNRVCVNGNWYNIDVTHDDPLYWSTTGEVQDAGYDAVPVTTYFLKSDDWFKQNPSAGKWHTTWSPDGIAGTDTSYDDGTNKGVAWHAYDVPKTIFSLVPNQTVTSLIDTVVISLESLHYREGADQVIYWSSADESIATVVDGTVTPKGAGSVVITCSIDGTTETVELTFVGLDISDSTSYGVEVGELVYDGTSQQPDIRVYMVGGSDLVQGTDYEITWHDAETINAGDYGFTIVGWGPYQNTIEGTYTIGRQWIDPFLLADLPDSYEYTGSAWQIFDGRILGGFNPETDYDVTYENNVNAGTAYLVFTFKGNYEGESRHGFQITPASIDQAAIVLSGTSFTYNKNAQKPTVKTVDGKSLVAGTDYVLHYSNANSTAAGTYTVWVVGTGNYQGTSATASYTIAAASLSAVALKAATVTYSGKAQKPVVSSVKAGTLAVPTSGFTIAYLRGSATTTDFTSAGAITVKITGTGSFRGTKSVTYTIKAKAVTPTVTLAATSYVYNGKAKTPAVTVKVGSITLKKGTDYTVTYASGRKVVGAYKVTVKLKGNYSGSKAATFKIVPKATKLTSVAAGSKKFTAKWAKQATQTTGYQVQYSTSSSFAKNNKAFLVTSNKTFSKAVGSLKAKTKYYVRIRTYKVVNGTKYYSAWSAKKAVTTKA